MRQTSNTRVGQIILSLLPKDGSIMKWDGKNEAKTKPFGESFMPDTEWQEDLKNG